VHPVFFPPERSVAGRLPAGRVIAALLVCAVVLGLGSFVPAPARPLDDRRDDVRKELRRAERHLNHSTAALVRAGRRVAAAEARLAAARSTLQRRSDEVAVAVVLDNQMQSQLDLATARLERAQESLAQARGSYRRQEAVLRSIAAQTYQVGSPTLLGVSMVLTSRDPSELSSQLNTVQTVLDKEAANLSRLEASRLLLQLQQQRVAEAVAEVETRRAEAAETLARREAAERRATSATRQVQALVQRRREVRAEAAKARAADRKRVRQVVKERNQVERLLRQRAAAERRRARARASRARAASRKRSGAVLMRPVDTYITSPYGMRLHPIFRYWRLHDGTDFGGSCGTPVRAAASGKVLAVYYNSGYGKRVIISHGYLRGSSVSTSYNHLSAYSTYSGQRVRRGEVIGFIGNTGFSTGCHLHFMVFRNGRTTDPMNWLK
jgi:murein DD-endopeptidase MepM/ murein hydrolase activator NlpD